MVGGLDDVAHVDAFIVDAGGFGFEDVARLIVGQAFAPDVVRVVDQVDLDFMANAAGALAGLFIPQNLQQRSWRFLIAATGF